MTTEATAETKTVYELRPGTGSAFFTTEKSNANSPDFKGKIKLLTGEMIHFVGWKKTGRENKEYFSLALNKKFHQLPGQLHETQENLTKNHVNI